LDKHFADFASPFTVTFLFLLRRYIKRETVFPWLSKHLEFRQYTPLHVGFLTLFSVFAYPDETLSVMFDVLPPSRDNVLPVTHLHHKNKHNLILEHLLVLFVDEKLSEICVYYSLTICAFIDS